MNIPEWIKPALTGAGVGAIAMAIVGFSWGGWVTGGAAADLSSDAADAAVVSALTPYCVQQSMTDPQAAAVLAELDAASSFARRGVVERSGWATPAGSDDPHRGLAQACQLELQAS